jgi:hypothetical protein
MSNVTGEILKWAYWYQHFGKDLLPEEFSSLEGFGEVTLKPGLGE